jgi:protein SCO1/2
MADAQSPRPKSWRRWLPLAGFGVAVIVLALAFALPRILSADRDGPGLGGPFALVDQHGAAVTEASFKGRWMLVYFGYTYCPDVCPTTLATIGRALDMLPADARKQVAPIFITVDPERDTAKVMGDYVANFAPDLVGLTGPLPAIEKVEHEYHVYAKKHPEADGSYSMDHSSIVYLMDPGGRYRAIFSGETTAAQMADGLKKQLQG